MSGTMMAVPSTSLTAVASLMVRKYRKNRIVLYQSMKLHARLVVSDKAEASQPMTWLYNMGNQLKAYWSRCFLVFFLPGLEIIITSMFWTLFLYKKISFFSILHCCFLCLSIELHIKKNPIRGYIYLCWRLNTVGKILYRMINFMFSC